jgi:hypothetical protein
MRGSDCFANDAVKTVTGARRVNASRQHHNWRPSIRVVKEMVRGLAVAALLIDVTPAIGCSPQLALAVNVDHPPPVIRSTLDLHEIRALAASLAQPLHHDAFGFYVATFGYDIQSRYNLAGPLDCGVIIARIRLFLENRAIEIASDLQNHGCRRESITEHYMLHARTDDEALVTYAGRIVEALTTRFTSYSLGDSDPNDIRQAAGIAIKEVVSNELRSFTYAREMAATAADNDQELNRLASACLHPL